MNRDSLRGLFFIMIGDYTNNKGPVIECPSGSKFIGGYDPSDDSNRRWYMIRDNITFHCVYSGSDYDKVLKGLERVIVRYRTREAYFKDLSKYTTEDYYNVAYLGDKPASYDQINKMLVGKCPRVSPSMKELYGAVFTHYGDYFEEDVKRVEDLAYQVIKEDTPTKKASKLMKKSGLLNKVRTRPLAPPKESKPVENKPVRKKPVGKSLVKGLKPVRKINI